MHVQSCIKHVLYNSFLGHLQRAQKCSIKQHFMEWESLQRSWDPGPCCSLFRLGVSGPWEMQAPRPLTRSDWARSCVVTDKHVYKKAGWVCALLSGRQPWTPSQCSTSDWVIDESNFSALHFPTCKEDIILLYQFDKKEGRYWHCILF